MQLCFCFFFLMVSSRQIIDFFLFMVVYYVMLSNTWHVAWFQESYIKYQ